MSFSIKYMRVLNYFKPIPLLFFISIGASSVESKSSLDGVSSEENKPLLLKKSFYRDLMRSCQKNPIRSSAGVFLAILVLFLFKLWSVLNKLSGFMAELAKQQKGKCSPDIQKKMIAYLKKNAFFIKKMGLINHVDTRLFKNIGCLAIEKNARHVVSCLVQDFWEDLDLMRRFGSKNFKITYIEAIEEAELNINETKEAVQIKEGEPDPMDQNKKPNEANPLSWEAITRRIEEKMLALIIENMEVIYNDLRQKIESTPQGATEQKAKFLTQYLYVIAALEELNRFYARFDRNNKTYYTETFYNRYKPKVDKLLQDYHIIGGHAIQEGVLLAKGYVFFHNWRSFVNLKKDYRNCNFDLSYDMAYNDVLEVLKKSNEQLNKV